MTTSYSNILVRTDGQLTTEGIEKQFDEPLKDGLDRILNNERQGLIPQAPLLLLALLGAFWMLTDQRQRALGAAYLSILGFFLILHAKYAYTYGRFFLPVVGISVLPLGALLERGSRWLDRLVPKREGISNRLFAVAIAALLIVLEFMVHRHGEVSAEDFPMFPALFGFIAFLFIVQIGKWLRMMIMRDEDYYDD